MEKLRALGFDQFFLGQLEDFENELPHVGRVMSIQRGQCFLEGEAGSKRAKYSMDLAVGDFCIYRPINEDVVSIERVLKRKSILRRHRDSDGNSQNICANIDCIFLVTSLNSEFKLNRVERYLIAIRDSGAEPVIILTKKDLCADPERLTYGLSEAARGTLFFMVNSRTGEGMADLVPYLCAGSTVGFIGSSGVGKTTLINSLKKGVQLETQEISYGDRGRHTTTHRELIPLDSGAMVIDTPGMREFSPLDSDSINEVFDDILALSQGCKFRDCMHLNEPGCAVIEALANEKITQRRLENYHKLRCHQQRIDNPRYRDEDKRFWKSVTKELRRIKKTKADR